jgi:hypothetical protein
VAVAELAVVTTLHTKAMLAVVVQAVVALAQTVVKEALA